jgi:hypothetical protein
VTAAAVDPAVVAPLVVALGGLASIAVALRIDSFGPMEGIAVVAFLIACGWMFFSERYALTLAVVALYLGTVDGYLKLRTGSEYATLARDALLYAVCFGFLMKAVVRRQRLLPPPFTGVLLVYVVLVLVQVANPGTGDLGRGLAALRPHVEFIPLFFLAYMTVRTKTRLRGLLVLLVVMGAANGIASYMQFSLTPEELSQWGPGYAERIAGTGPVSARVFFDSQGEERVRPFGLAADNGQGGFVALLALPAALALMSSVRKRWRCVVLPLSFAVVLAIVTSQGRNVFIGTFVAVLAYTVLTLRARQLVATLAGITVVTIALAAAMSLATDRAGSRVFDRVQEIAPSRILDSASEQRGSSVERAPTYLAQYPFGAGLGSVGPAATVGRARNWPLDGETEFNFLILELGAVGACLFLGLFAAIVVRGIRRLRALADPELRASLAALAAPLLGMVVMFLSAAITAGSPGGPYFWAISGVLAYWIGPSRPADPRQPCGIGQREEDRAGQEASVMRQLR